MGRKGARSDKKIATPVYEQFIGIKHNCIDVDQAVEQIPNTNLSYRKGIIVQNGGSSGILHIGGGIPYLIKGKYGDTYTDDEHDQRKLVWNKSSSGTNEWYLASGPGDQNPGLTQVTYLYYATVGGTETLATSGTVGSLAAQHRWGWGTSADVTGNTLFIRTGGNNPAVDYELLHAYYFTLTADDTAATGGYELGPGDAVNLPLDGSVRLFAIGSADNIPAKTLEYV